MSQKDEKTLRKSVVSWLRAKAPTRTLSQRMFKSTVNSTIALILCLNPTTLKHLGGEPAMVPLIAVMVHPGRRLGSMLESVFLNSTGLLVGNAYALFSRFIAQKIAKSQLSDVAQLQENYTNYRAALSWLAVMHILMLFFHGWMRSISHKFFFVVFPIFLVVHFTFTSDLATSAATTVEDFTIPFFLGIGVSLACNLLIFPEFGSSYLGTSVTQTIAELQTTIDSAITFFINPDPSVLVPLVKRKTTLRSKLASTQAVLQECTYEISYSYLSPAQLKPTIDIIKTQLSYTNALINACQLELSTGGDLRNTLNPTHEPLRALKDEIFKAIHIVGLAVSYSYDAESYNNQELQSVDFEDQLNSLTRAVAQLDISFREEIRNLSTETEDMMKPNDEMFLLSSFLMNLKETSNCICNLLKQSQFIYNYRMERENKGFFGRRVWVSFLFSKAAMKEWYYTNRIQLTDETATLNGDTSSKVYITKEDPKPPRRSVTHHSLALLLLDFYNSHKPHFRFGTQCAVGLTLATFPMFIPEARHWFVDIRGTWIGFVCILVLEPEIGSTFFVFFLRGVGVISGAAWGYLSYVAAINQTNPYLETVVTVIGAIPGYYFFLGTPYVKAAIIGIISIYIVLLSAVIPSEIGGSILENFGKRCLAMIYGGAVALLCQVAFFPIKARDELTNEVVDSLERISKLILLYASALDGESLQMSLSPKRFDAFKKVSAATKSALSRADAFRASAKKEPRLKGSYDDIEKIFYEIIFILREILDRLDNIVQLRRTYGSAIIEEFNADAHPYRRQLSASMNNTLKAVQFALQTKSPIPQYLPSSRISHERLVKKVTELVQTKYTIPKHDTSSDSDNESDLEIVVNFRNRRSDALDKMLKEKFMSWNASSSATEEVIRYIEELVELTKVLVGVNEFKYGFLSRSLYSNYAADAARGYQQLLTNAVNPRTDDEDSGVDDDDDDDQSENSMDMEDNEPVAILDNRSIHTAGSGISNGFRKRVYSLGSWMRGDDQASAKSLGQLYTDDEGDFPLSLMRVVSRKSTSGNSYGN